MVVILKHVFCIHDINNYVTYLLQRKLEMRQNLLHCYCELQNLVFLRLFTFFLQKNVTFSIGNAVHVH